MRHGTGSRAPVLLAAGVALASLGAVHGHAAAQDMPMTTTSYINAGVMQHRFEGSGTNPFFAFRTDYVVSDHSIAELAVGYGQPEQDFGRSHFVLAEGQYQLRLPLERFAPYAGMGAGVAMDSPVDGDAGAEWFATFSVGAGVRAWVDERTRIRTDVRWRGLGADFRSSSLELTFGLGWRW